MIACPYQTAIPRNPWEADGYGAIESSAATVQMLRATTSSRLLFPVTTMIVDREDVEGHCAKHTAARMTLMTLPILVSCSPALVTDRGYGNGHGIRLKAEIMVDHFHEQVIGLQKVGGQAMAMVVTGSIERAIRYYHAIRDYLAERKSPYQAIVAFSGEHEYAGTKVTEASLNRLLLEPHRRRDSEGSVPFPGLR